MWESCEADAKSVHHEAIPPWPNWFSLNSVKRHCETLPSIGKVLQIRVIQDVRSTLVAAYRIDFHSDLANLFLENRVACLTVCLKIQDVLCWVGCRII